MGVDTLSQGGAVAKLGDSAHGEAGEAEGEGRGGMKQMRGDGGVVIGGRWSSLGRPW